MSLITADTKCRLCRSAGKKLYLKGNRCLSPKCPLEKKGAVPPGMHGIKIRRKPTDYALQLRAKQEVKRIYGVNETQFKNYYLKAKKLKGLVGDNLLNLLERRLDNVVFLSGLSLSRSHARQLVSHSHFLINDKPPNVPSYPVVPGDKIVLDKKTADKFKDLLRLFDKDFKAPSWLSLEKKLPGVKVNSHPSGTSEDNEDLNINLIIEYYSR